MTARGSPFALFPVGRAVGGDHSRRAAPDQVYRRIDQLCKLYSDVGDHLYMAAIRYGGRQIPNRDTWSTRIAVLAPFALSTVALVCTYLLAPDALLNSAPEPQPLYSVFLVAVPIIYIIAVLAYTMKRAIAIESRIERRSHILVGLFPLMLIEFRKPPAMPVEISRKRALASSTERSELIEK